MRSCFFSLVCLFVSSTTEKTTAPISMKLGGKGVKSAMEESIFIGSKRVGVGGYINNPACRLSRILLQVNLSSPALRAAEVDGTLQ